MDVINAVIQSIKKTRPCLWLLERTGQYPVLLSTDDVKDDMLYFLTCFAQDVLCIANSKESDCKNMARLRTLIKKVGFEGVT
ncbi:MAG: hypothetical protein FWH03_07850 [Firmicutes bacterium]|nr:hypothetical protein [Bacillota bacterium]